MATIQRDRGPNFIMRENVQRKIVVQCNVAGRDLRSVVDDIQARVGSERPAAAGLPRRVRRAVRERSAGVATAPVALASASSSRILFVLTSAFGSSRDALLIMLNLPLALIGGVVGVYLAGGVLSVASIVGFITLFGIATRNGIMLVSHIRHLQEHEGVTDFREAVIRGATERLAPILMTALAAGLALVPIALSAGEPGNEIQAPMAIVILFGLLSSTALNMIVVPILYERFGRTKMRERATVADDCFQQPIAQKGAGLTAPFPSGRGPRVLPARALLLRLSVVVEEYHHWLDVGHVVMNRHDLESVRA